MWKLEGSVGTFLLIKSVKDELKRKLSLKLKVQQQQKEKNRS